MCSFERNWQTALHGECSLLYSCLQWMRVPVGPYLHWVVVMFWILAILIGVWWYLIVLICIFLMTYDAGHLFECLFVICMFLMTCLLRCLAHFCFFKWASCPVWNPVWSLNSWLLKTWAEIRSHWMLNWLSHPGTPWTFWVVCLLWITVLSDKCLLQILCPSLQLVF